MYCLNKSYRSLMLLVRCDRRRRFWHATHDCAAPYMSTSSSTEGGSEPNVLRRGA